MEAKKEQDKLAGGEGMPSRSTKWYHDSDVMTFVIIGGVLIALIVLSIIL